MTDTNIEEIKELLENKFLNNTITICVEGAIETTFSITNTQYFLSKTIFILSNGEYNEIKIDVYWINNVKIENECICLSLEGNYNIKIDC